MSLVYTEVVEDEDEDEDVLEEEAGIVEEEGAGEGGEIGIDPIMTYN